MRIIIIIIIIVIIQLLAPEIRIYNSCLKCIYWQCLVCSFISYGRNVVKGKTDCSERTFCNQFCRCISMFQNHSKTLQKIPEYIFPICLVVVHGERTLVQCVKYVKKWHLLWALYNFNPWAVSEGSAWFADWATLITPLNGLGPEYKNCTASWVYMD